MKRDATTQIRLWFAIGLTLALAGSAFGEQGVEADLDKIISLELEDSTVRTALEAIGAAGELQFVFDRKVNQNALTSVSLSDVSVQYALRFVTQSNCLFYVPRGSHTILIAPDNRHSRQEHLPQETRTVELEHADPKTVISVLRSLLQIPYLVLVDGQNTITIKDTIGQLDIAEEVIDHLDRKSGEAPDIRPVDREPWWIGSEENQNLRSKGDPIPQLEVDLEQTVAFDPDDTTARQVYATLGSAAGIRFVFDCQIDLDRPASLATSRMSLQEALDFVNQQFEHFSVVRGPRTIFIAPDTYGREMFEQHLAIQFFYLSHAEPRDVITMLRSKLQSRRVVEIPRLNAIAINDDVASLRTAQELIERMDRADGGAASI